MIIKFFIIPFFLFFSSLVIAEDISEFQIEGISIGDSLLDYYDKDYINNKIVKVYRDNKYTTIEIIDSSSFNTYDAIQINYKRNDKRFIIEELTGLKIYRNNIKSCIKKMQEISDELKKVFNNPIIKSFKVKHGYDKSKKSIVHGYDIFLTANSKNNEGLLNCIDWSKEIENRKGWSDHLRVTIFTDEYSYWLTNKAYN